MVAWQEKSKEMRLMQRQQKKKKKPLYPFKNHVQVHKIETKATAPRFNHTLGRSRCGVRVWQNAMHTNTYSKSTSSLTFSTQTPNTLLVFYSTHSQYATEPTSIITTTTSIPIHSLPPPQFLHFYTRQLLHMRVIPCPNLHACSKDLLSYIIPINTPNIPHFIHHPSRVLHYSNTPTQLIFNTTTLCWEQGFRCCWEFFSWHHFLSPSALYTGSTKSAKKSRNQEDKVTPSTSTLTGGSTLYSETNMVTFVSSRGSTNAPNKFRILKTTVL